MKCDIFIIGTPIHNYTKVISEAFIKNKISVHYETYKKPNPVLKSIPLISSLYNSLFVKWSGRYFYRKLNDENLQFDILLLFGLNNIPKEKLAYLKQKKNFKIVIWFIDSIYNYTKLFDLIEITEYLLCYNQSEAKSLKGQGFNSLFLPLAYDSSSYYPYEMDKKYDLYFIGTLKSRIHFFEELFLKLSSMNLKIRMEGRLSPLYILKNRKKFPFFFKYHHNKYGNHTDINMAYNSSRICLNYQPSQAESGFSIRTYEICGAGGFQLSDGNKNLLNELFSVGQEIEYYNNIDDLARLIQFYLKEENIEKRQRIAHCGYSKARENHNFDFRVKEVINFIS